MYPMNILTENIVRERILALQEKGNSLTALAKKSGVPQSSLWKFMSGGSIYLTTLEKLWPFIYGNESENHSTTQDETTHDKEGRNHGK